MSSQEHLRAVANAFNICGEFLGAAPYGSGHINDTYRAEFNQGGTRVHYILQRINHKVFQNPPALMQNVQRVTAHIAGKVATEHDCSRRGLTLIAARDGRCYHQDSLGNFWRGYIFIEHAHTYDTAQSEAQVYEAARAFGSFQHWLADLPPPRLHETIPNFHNTPARVAALEQAITADVANRAIQSKPEIEFVLRRKSWTGALMNASLPQRVTHNDTKLNNVMLDDATGAGICVIDLDTVMPGLVLYDFGDMVRTVTSPAKEDERDLSKVTMRFPMFAAVARGYLEAASGFLAPSERRHLAFSGKLITLEIGIRFLTDFLAGDTYFKVHRDGQNLDRCRTQFRLVESIEEQEERMSAYIGEL
jgi:phosphotransferase family enzyme